MTAEPRRTTDDQGPSIPITDIDRSDVNAADAENVKGGLGNAFQLSRAAANAGAGTTSASQTSGD